MDPFGDEAARLIAGGADPRRAGPAAAEFFGLPRAIGARQAFWAGLALGIAIMMASASAGAWYFDLRPAGNTQITTARVEAALSPIPEAQRATVLASLVRLTPLLHDPIALTILQAVRDLSEQERTTLAQGGRLRALLGWAAQMNDNQQAALLAWNLPPLLADPDRFALLQLLPGLDLLTTKFLVALRSSSFTQRQTLIAALTFIDRNDARFARAVAAFQYDASSLVKLLDGRLANCTFSDRGACR